MITARKVQQVERLDNPMKVNARRIFDSPHAQIMHLELSAGQTIPKHTSPMDVAFYVLQGQGEIQIGDESVVVESDTLVESPANSPHLLRNTGAGSFRLLVIKTPRP